MCNICDNSYIKKPMFVVKKMSPFGTDGIPYISSD